MTYHGPGQIVGYPILDLRPDRQDVHRYVRDLEEVMIRTCARLRRRSRACAGLDRRVGGDRRAARKRSPRSACASRAGSRATGSRSTSNTDLDFFELIVPCGIADRGVTSLAGGPATRRGSGVGRDRVIAHFAAVFGRDPTAQQPDRALAADVSAS